MVDHIYSTPYGLFLLANPCLIHNGSIQFRDSCYVDTIRQTQLFTPRSLIVARIRQKGTNIDKHSNLDIVNAELALGLPDYGDGGLRGLRQAFKILLDSGIKRNLFSLIEQADFIYVEGGGSLESFLTALLARRAGRRLILEMRGSTLLNKIYMKQRFGVVGLALVFLHNVFLSYVCKQSLAGLYINKSLLPEYPVKGDIKTAASDAYIPSDFGSSSRHFTKPANSYLYVGHLEAVKRVDLIIEALNLVRERLPSDWHFDVVGSGPLENELKELCKRLGLNDHITFHGRIQWGEPIARLYLKTNVVLMASTTEGASRTLIEAMAFGLPVVSTCVGTAPELLDEFVLVPVGNVDTYADCLVRLVNDPKLLNECSAHNWQLSQEFKRPVLEAKRQVFWENAIYASRESSCLKDPI